ncbi:MAG TPA: acyl-CoA dehydrogenase family protein [Gemmataceae bacterium]|nr:acyl-CoA dehydrogenase family protein [Gemmataceae bacterium]
MPGPPLDPRLLAELAANADPADASPDWPAASWAVLARAGVTGWSVPATWGGTDLPAPDRLAGLEQLGAACLTTTFILSQQESAIRILLGSQALHLHDAYLPGVVRGETYLTVGLSQLTTSRQHRAPALVARPASGNPGRFRINGEVPWVTGADGAAGIVVGATLEDGRQLVFLLPAGQPGVLIDPPLPLAALVGSRTSLLRCDAVEIGPEWVLAGPGEQVLGKGVGGGPDTSALGLGLARAAIAYLREESRQRPDVAAVADRFEAAHADALRQLLGLADGAATLESVMAVRATSTRLALRSAQAALAVAKGTGFVAPHPARRWARQALFFLVWSCPRPVAERVLDDLGAGL